MSYTAKTITFIALGCVTQSINSFIYVSDVPSSNLILQCAVSFKLILDKRRASGLLVVLQPKIAKLQCTHVTPTVCNNDLSFTITAAFALCQAFKEVSVVSCCCCWLFGYNLHFITVIKRL